MCHFHHMTHDACQRGKHYSSHHQQSEKRADVVDICAAITQHQHTGEMDNAVQLCCNTPVSLFLGHRAACPLCCLLLLPWVELSDQRRLCHPQVLPCKIKSNKLKMEYMADQGHADQARMIYPCSTVLACLSSPFIPLSPLSALTVNTRRGAHRAAGPARAASSRVASVSLIVVKIVTRRNSDDVASAQ